MKKIKRISLKQAADGNIYVQDLLDTIVNIEDKLDEIVEHINQKSRWPLREGKREMYAIFGTEGGIYGFSTSASKAKDIQKNYWNIGDKKPERYIVIFKKI